MKELGLKYCNEFKLLVIKYDSTLSSMMRSYDEGIRKLETVVNDWRHTPGIIKIAPILVSKYSIILVQSGYDVEGVCLPVVHHILHHHGHDPQHDLCEVLQQDLVRVQTEQ